MESSGKAEATTTTGLETLPLRVLIIDDDTSLPGAITKLLKDQGVQSVDAADEGGIGFEKLKSAPYDFVILDWKMAPVSGASVLHKIRSSKEFEDLPVLVVSGYIKKRDFRFAEEYLFTSLLEKPFDNFFLIRRIKDLMKEKRWYESEKIRIGRLIDQVTDKNPGNIKDLVKALLESPRVVAISLHAARNKFEHNDLFCAEAILKALIQKSPECVLALSMLGKILLHRKEYDKALQVLEQAQSLSPENPDRLCMLGNANLQMLRTEEAKDYFEKAEKIDPTFEKAKAGKELATNIESYLNDSDLSSVPTSFVSLLNSVGVAFVRNDRYQDGLKHYESALQYVDQDVMQARLAFNMGLGFLRWKKKDEALKWFEKSAKLGGDEFSKASGYVERLTNGGALPAFDFEKVSAPELEQVVMPDVSLPDLEGPLPGLGSSLTSLIETAPKAVSTGAAPVDSDAFGFDADSFLSGGDDFGADNFVKAPPQFGKMEEKKKKTNEGLDAETIRIQSMMLHLVMADKTLFKTTGQMQHKNTHDAYSGTFDGKKFAVFVPNTHAPQLLTRPENLDLLRKKVFVLEKTGMVWKSVWPRQTVQKASA